MNVSQKTQIVSAACWMSLSTVGQAGDGNLPVYLHTIAQVETGDNPTKIGRDGERTRWQIRRTEWEQRSRVPFWQADDLEGRRVAATLLASRIREFEQKHAQAPTPAQVYLLWHRPAHVLSPTAVEKERASRFANLYAVEISAVNKAKAGKTNTPTNNFSAHQPKGINP